MAKNFGQSPVDCFRVLLEEGSKVALSKIDAAVAEAKATPLRTIDDFEAWRSEIKERSLTRRA